MISEDSGPENVDSFDSACEWRKYLKDKGHDLPHDDQFLAEDFACRTLAGKDEKRLARERAKMVQGWKKAPIRVGWKAPSTPNYRGKAELGPSLLVASENQPDTSNPYTDRGHPDPRRPKRFSPNE
jgi:hypothetical protein